MKPCLVDRVLTNEGRTASLLRGSASKKVAAERDMHVTLWKNYVVMGCCIAPPSHAVTNVLTADHRCVTPDMTGYVFVWFNLVCWHLHL